MWVPYCYHPHGVGCFGAPSGSVGAGDVEALKSHLSSWGKEDKAVGLMMKVVVTDCFRLQKMPQNHQAQALNYQQLQDYVAEMTMLKGPALAHGASSHFAHPGQGELDESAALSCGNASVPDAIAALTIGVGGAAASC